MSRFKKNLVFLLLFILCPETQPSNTNTLIGGRASWVWVASFHEEAMTFEELLQKAEQKMLKPGTFLVGKQ